MGSRLAVTLVVLAVLVLAAPSASVADHVVANPSTSARLGERASPLAWRVIVDWGIGCTGAAAPDYGGNLKLVDQVTDEETYLGGTFGASGQSVVSVSMRAKPRYLSPVIKSWCSTGLPELHGSATVEVTGNPVEIPGLDQDAGTGGERGGQGGRDFPGGGFGAPSDPLGSAGCGRYRKGTPRSDDLRGTSLGDLIAGLGGNDVIRGNAGADCLIGGDGNDRLIGGNGSDRLTGGSGDDTLVGGSGINRYDAGSGDDTVSAANGRRELVSCGAGRDRARVDRRDRVAGCEKLTRVS